MFRGPQPTRTIGQLVERESGLSTFSDAVQRAGLEDLLGGQDFITVFAPIDEAFENIQSDILEDEDELKAVILRHIVPGFPRRRVDLPAGDSSLETAGGEQITVTKSSSNKISAKSSFGSGKAVRHDVLGTNGVIFWLDGVL